jgi:hypothetical protein
MAPLFLLVADEVLNTSVSKWPISHSHLFENIGLWHGLATSKLAISGSDVLSDCQLYYAYTTDRHYISLVTPVTDGCITLPQL